MELKQAKNMAKELIKQYCPEYKLTISGGKQVFGACNWRRKIIKLSRYLTQLNEEQQVKDVILHEIAHALTPGEGHGSEWRIKAAEIGCNAKRCYGEEVKKPEAKYIYKCPNCDREVARYRRSNKIGACSECCNKHNNGKYIIDFQLELKNGG